MAILTAEQRKRSPLVLLVPGLNNSGSEHWQSRWEQTQPNCERVELGMWENPHRNTWVNKLNLAIRRAERPVILVAHSLGCHAVAWWAEYERPRFTNPVTAALLVAPPEVEGNHLDERLRRFAPVLEAKLPFPSILVASKNDPYASLQSSKRIAKAWGSRFINIGDAGHINADSGFGDWEYGQRLLKQMKFHSQGAEDPEAYEKKCHANLHRNSAVTTFYAH